MSAPLLDGHCGRCRAAMAQQGTACAHTTTAGTSVPRHAAPVSAAGSAQGRIQDGGQRGEGALYVRAKRLLQRGRQPPARELSVAHRVAYPTLVRRLDPTGKLFIIS